MIDEKKTEEAILTAEDAKGFLSYIEPSEAKTYDDAISLLQKVAESVLAASDEIPIKPFHLLNCPASKGLEAKCNCGAFHMAAIRDAFALTIAKEYVRKDKLPTVERILKILTEYHYGDRRECAQAISEEIRK